MPGMVLEAEETGEDRTEKFPAFKNPLSHGIRVDASI